MKRSTRAEGDGSLFRRPGRALLICNGEPPSGALIRRLVRRSDLVVAADGGANAARALGVTPHVIIGDLDSITPATRAHFGAALLLRVPRQDNTDLEKALDYLMSLKAKEVVIAGATGRRIDFTLANLSVLWRYVHAFRVTVVGEGWRAIPARGVASVVARPGTTLSLLPFGRVTGITLRGLYYPLRNGTLRTGEVAVSNVVTRSPCSVRVGSGKLLVIVQDGRLPGDPGETGGGGVR
jgi:thiamine pyrophosphokinase